MTGRQKGDVVTRWGEAQRGPAGARPLVSRFSSMATVLGRPHPPSWKIFKG